MSDVVGLAQLEIDFMELITNEEKVQLQERVDALIANRKVLVARIAEARAQGDLKENADYHAAREDQGMEEAEIKRLQEKLDTAQVVDQAAAAEAAMVFVGSMVRMREVETDDEDEFRLVGESSGDPFVDYVEVTVSSPMGQAMLKAQVGETIRVDTPRGVKRFEVLELL